MWSSVPASTVASSPAPGAEENDAKDDEKEALDTDEDKMDADDGGDNVDMHPPHAVEVFSFLLFFSIHNAKWHI
jgi:hypothetical protein